jgi:hypothetical protein
VVGALVNTQAFSAKPTRCPASSSFQVSTMSSPTVCGQPPSRRIVSVW